MVQMLVTVLKILATPSIRHPPSLIFSHSSISRGDFSTGALAMPSH